MEFSEKAAVYAKSSYQATVALRDFVDSKVAPVLYAQVQTSPFEEALVGLYFRMILWCRSLALLDEPDHFQAVRAGARAAFELHLDIHLLDQDPAGAEKMFAFTKVWKYRSAQKLMNFVAARTLPLDHPAFRHQRTLVSDPGKLLEYDELMRQHWPQQAARETTPQNWAGKTIDALAREGGPEFELRYREEYGLASQFVHSGIVTIDNMSREALVIAYARGRLLFQESLLKATSIVAGSLHLFDAIPNLKTSLDELEKKPDSIIAQTLLSREAITPPRLLVALTIALFSA